MLRRRRPDAVPCTTVVIPEGGAMHRRSVGKALGTFVAASAMLADPHGQRAGVQPDGRDPLPARQRTVPEGAGQLRGLPEVGAAAERAAGRVVREVHGRAEDGQRRQTDPPRLQERRPRHRWQPLSEVKAPAYLSKRPQVREVHEQLDEPVPLHAAAGRREPQAGHAAPRERRVRRRLLLQGAQGGRPELDADQRRRPQGHGDRPVLQHRPGRDAGRSSTSSPPAAGRAAARARSGRTSRPRTRTSRWTPSGSRT